MTFPKHIQAAIEKGPQYYPLQDNGAMPVLETYSQFATRIARMVAKWKDNEHQRELREAVRDAASEGLWQERQGDDYGSY